MRSTGAQLCAGTQAATAVTQELDSHNAEHAEYWGALAVVADAELAEAQRQDDADRARMRGEAPPADARAGAEAGLHGAVDADIHLMLAGAPAGEGAPCMYGGAGMCCRAGSVGQLRQSHVICIFYRPSGACAYCYSLLRPSCYAAVLALSRDTSAGCSHAPCRRGACTAYMVPGQNTP